MTLFGRTKHALAAVLQRALARRGYVIARPERLEAAERTLDSEARHLRTVRQLHDVYQETVFPGIPRRDGRVELLARMRGTEVSAAMFLLHHLHEALCAPGDVCEFGVAQGRTSALIANELMEVPGRMLWLYDTFRGLPAPSEADALVDDLLRLGDMRRYEGRFAYGDELVRAELAAVGFPPERTRIVGGEVPRDLTDDWLPEQVAFAYVDVDLYEGTLGALEAVHDRLSSGSTVMVDDFAFFTTGPKTAVDEFLASRPLLYELEIGPEYAGHFCALRRR